RGLFHMASTEQLFEIYRKFPCRTLPNAFWKTASRLDGGTLDIQSDHEGNLVYLKVVANRACLAFWCANPSELPTMPDQINPFEIVLVHDSCRDAFSSQKFKQNKPYFRIRHKGKVERHDCPPGFLFKEANPETEIEAVVSFIQSCYQNISVTPEIVHGWLSHPVFDPTLWVWIIEANSGQKAALGIAELDPAVPEASLEWIQVRPEFQQRGLGKALVIELLARVDGKVLFTTVSGETNNKTQPERLYRNCGFTGSDIWWLLTN
ncbi:MAG: GNAT family N-acetyltransferase, partial [Brevefilum sp.]